MQFGWSSWAALAYLLLGSRSASSSPLLHGRSLSYYELVLSFVFGEADPEARRAADEGRSFLAWAALRRGLVSAEEYALHFGLGLAEAEEGLAGHAAEYGGEARALGAGLLAWHFPGLCAGNGPGGGAGPALPAIPYRRMLPFSDNPPGADRVAAISGSAAIVFGAFTTEAVLQWLQLDASHRFERYALETLVTVFGLMPPALSLWLFGLVPLAAGAVGILLPLGRELVRLRENARRRALNARIVAGRRLLAAGGELELSCSEPERPRADARRSLEELAAEFGATISAQNSAEYGATISARDSGQAGTDDCTLSYRSRLAEMLEMLEIERSTLPPCAEADGIVFDSGR